jgi:hypothetical protein
LAQNVLWSIAKEVIQMEYFVFAVGAGAILLLGARAFHRLERWDRRRRLRGAQECLDAVHNALAELANRKGGDSKNVWPLKIKSKTPDHLDG